MTVKFKAGDGMGLTYNGFRVFESKLNDDKIYRIYNDIYVPPKLLKILRNAEKAHAMVSHLRDSGNNVSQVDNYFDNLSNRIGVPEIDEFLKKEDMEI